MSDNDTTDTSLTVDQITVTATSTAADTAPTAEATAGGDTAPVVVESGTTSSDTSTDGGDLAGKVVDADAIIKALRAENAKTRVKAKTAEQNAADLAADAAKKARDEITQSLSKALGLASDDAEVDPQKLIDEATAKAAASETAAAANAQAAKATAVELALYKAANKAGADADALLDSRSVLKIADSLDPSDDDFASLVESAVAKVIEANPRFLRKRAAVTATRSGGDLSAGNGEPEKKADDFESIRSRVRKRLESR